MKLDYHLEFDGAPNAGNNDITDEVDNFNGTAPTAIVTFDAMLQLPGSQNLVQELTPGRRYEFYKAA